MLALLLPDLRHFWNIVAYFKARMTKRRAPFLSLCNVADKFRGKTESLEVSFSPVVNDRGLLTWSNTQTPFQYPETRESKLLHAKGSF